MKAIFKKNVDIMASYKYSLGDMTFVTISGKRFHIRFVSAEIIHEHAQQLYNLFIEGEIF